MNNNIPFCQTDERQHVATGYHSCIQTQATGYVSVGKAERTSAVLLSQTLTRVLVSMAASLGMDLDLPYRARHKPVRDDVHGRLSAECHLW